MKKILYLINYAGSGGSEKYVRMMAESAAKEGCEVFFAYWEKGRLSEYMEEKGVKSFRIEMRSPFDIKAARRLAEICKKEGIDTVHVQFPRENCIAVLSRIFYRVRVIYTCHLLYSPTAVWSVINRLITPFDSRIIAVCQAVKRLLAAGGIKKDSIDVIYNGIDVRDMKKRDRDIRELHGIDKDAFLCVTLGRYTAEKGFDYLVRVFERLKGQAVCVIVGEGPMMGDIKAEIEKRGLEKTVIQAGYTDNVANYLESADLAINSSSSEAFSFAILEGCAKGLPTVATDVGGNGELLRSFNLAGEIVPFGDEEAMADKILRLKNDAELRKEYSQNAVRNIAEHFNTEKMISETLKIYKEN